VKVLFLVVILTSIVSLCLTVQAHEGAKGVIKQRMVAMKTMASSMKSLHAIATGKSIFDVEKVKLNTSTIRNEGGAKLLKLFPQGSLGYPSEAKPEIWEDLPAYVNLVADLSQKVDEMDSALSTAEPRVEFYIAFKNLARVCSNCHKRFRAKK
jgi:cytochrome c556